MPLTDNTVLFQERADVVVLSIKVDGDEIPREYGIVSVTIQQEINKIPTANLVVIDGEASTQDFAIASTGVFVPGKKLEVALSYLDHEDDDETPYLFTGIIVTNTHKVNNNCCELHIEAKDETVKMTINKGNAHYDKQTSPSDVAKTLLEKYNIKNPDVESVTLKHEQLLQSNVTDWDFMIGRIDVAGMICVINNGNVRIKKLAIQNPPKNNPDKMLMLVHGRNILEFSADKDSRIRNEEVKTFCWDFKKQEVREATNGESAVDESDSSDTTISPGYEMRSAAHFTPEEQESIVKTKKIKQDLSAAKGKVKYFGRTDIQVLPGDFIELSGVGKTFDGHHFVSAVQQEYSEGSWTTELTLGWNEQFFSEQTAPQHSASATGQTSSLQGLQIGIVTSILDPEGEYRVQVKLPMVDNSADGLHARVATLDAGNGRGTFFRPEIDDEVILGFINDDPSNPVILGMLHSSPKKSPLEPEEKNAQKGYVSRSKMKLLFNDEKKSVTIQTPGGRVFELNDDSGTITMKDDDGNKLVMESSGISIEAAKEINIKAGTNLSIQATQISIKADGSFEAKGSGSAKIEGGGLTEIKGGIVKIN